MCDHDSATVFYLLHRNKWVLPSLVSRSGVDGARNYLQQESSPDQTISLCSLLINDLAWLRLSRAKLRHEKPASHS